MVAQPLTQETAPPQFGEWLAEATSGLPARHYKPRRMKQELSRLEKDIDESEQLVNVALVGFVDFVRDAGQNDDAARKFDDWADGLDLAHALAAYEEKVIPGLKERAAILRKTVAGWRRLAEIDLIEPDLPPQLAGRVAQLDARVKELAEEVTRQYDNDLVARLLMRVGKQRKLTLDEQFRLVDAVRLDWKVKNEPSVRRADWYGDDGR